MKVKSIQTVFGDYKKTSMLISTCNCDWKCGKDLCQNLYLDEATEMDFSAEEILQSYKDSEIAEAIIFGGLEPFFQFMDMCEVIEYFRDNDCNDEFIIYTGYEEDEVKDELDILKQFDNIIVKFGRYKPSLDSKYNDLLGVELASSNQYAKRIS